MSQLTVDPSDDGTMPRIMAALRSCYGSLDAPDFRKVHERINSDQYRALVENLRTNGCEITQTTDENDDVSVQLVADKAGDQVVLGLSGVGLFAAVIDRSARGRYRWVTEPANAPTPLAAAIATVVKTAGFSLLDRRTMTSVIDMRRADGTTKATLYQALFTDTDRIP